MHTEEQARTKWCPHVRHGDDSGGSWNRTVRLMKRVLGWDGSNPYPEAACNCIASECMAWRFLPQEWEFRGQEGRTYTEKKPVNGYGVEGKKLPHVGYCGLAGKP
jgi:hypothetical protein